MTQPTHRGKQVEQEQSILRETLREDTHFEAFSFPTLFSSVLFWENNAHDVKLLQPVKPQRRD